jgi:transposase
MTLLTLNPQEWEALEHLAAHTIEAQTRRRAQALLWLDEAETVQEVAERLRVIRQVVYKWSPSYRAHGKAY